MADQQDEKKNQGTQHQDDLKKNKEQGGQQQDHKGPESYRDKDKDQQKKQA